MISFLPPTAVPQHPVAWVRITYTMATLTVEESFPSIAHPDPDWFTIAAVVQQTEFEREIEAFRKRAALLRLWSRLAFKEQARAVRRLRPRAPVGQPARPLFARRTCSQASRWMVLQ